MEYLVRLLLLMIIICSGCQDNTKIENPVEKFTSFYHWKSNARWSNSIENTLTVHNVNKLYMHFFDVDIVEENTKAKAYPKYVLTHLDEPYKHFEIIPVIFITNRTLKKDIDIEELSTRIKFLIIEMGNKQFGREFTEIQVDCDWTQSTANKYFKLINNLNEQFEVSTTIRLHQIKYYESTGVPPVKKGVLMLYNVGNLSDNESNSILDTEIVSGYINHNSTYPLKLDLALPLFSQTVIKNNEGAIRLLNFATPNQVANDRHFKQVADNLYDVVSDTLYHGFYLSPGYQLKLEILEEETIIKSAKVVKNSKLNLEGTIFYHLSDEVLLNISLDQITSSL